MILPLPNGNTTNVQRACVRLGIPVRISNDPAIIGESDGLILPGVGSADHAMAYLQATRLDQIICSYGKPFLGICLGMQLLFDSSEEGPTECLGIIRGKVVSLPETVPRPHIGWNKLSGGEYAYFAHSFICVPEEKRIVTMTVRHGCEIVAGIRKENFFGLQWHPEKSGFIGDRFLFSFSEFVRQFPIQACK